MEFEYLILQTLLSSDNIIEWRDKLKSQIRQYTGDDHTISLVAIGFKDFNEMQDYYLKRAETLYEHYIKNLKNVLKMKLIIYGINTKELIMERRNICM